jgi:hypothetical protein
LSESKQPYCTLASQLPLIKPSSACLTVILKTPAFPSIEGRFPVRIPLIEIRNLGGLTHAVGETALQSFGEENLVIFANPIIWD